MGRDHTLPRALGRVHPKRQTPLIALGVVGVIALALFVGSQKIGSLGTIMSDAFSAIGLQICVYYCLAAVAVVVAYRKLLLKSASNLLFIGIWPGAGAIFMAWVFYESLPALNGATKAIGLGALAIGIVPLAWYWYKGSSYYHSDRLDATHAEELSEAYAQDEAVLVPEATAAQDGLLATDL